MNITIQNSPEELQSFPLSQSITLEASDEIEEAMLKGNIALFRNPTPMHNLSDLYNYNIGYVKESFASVPIEIASKGSLLVVKPLEPLAPASSYTLFIDKNLGKEYIQIEKQVSKSNSFLELVGDADEQLPLDTTYLFKVLSYPSITAQSNLVRLQIYVNGVPKREVSINAKSDENTFKAAGYTIKVADVAYAQGEIFVLKRTTQRVTLPSNFIVEVKTVLNSKILPVENASKGLSNQDILDFYKEQEVEPSVEIEYVGYGKVLLHLTGVSVDDIDFKNIEMVEFPAYNRYDLEELGLYREGEHYDLQYKKLDESTLLMEWKHHE